MKLYEYQAKALFSKSGIPIPQGEVVKSVDELQNLRDLTYPVVVKSQVLVGGRGKAGGIKFANDKTELRSAVETLLNNFQIKGYPVEAVLIEEKVPVVEECYLSVTLDRAFRMPLIMFSRSGGVDIEEVAKTNPQAIAKVQVDPAMGLRGFHLERLMQEGGVTDPEVKKEIKKVVQALYSLYRESDAMLVEINPLMILEDKTVVAADGKMETDDSALFRQPEQKELLADQPINKLEKKASDTGFLYIDVNDSGNVGVISNGSGMIMSCIDWIARQGGQVTCALDLGGGATADRVAEGIKIVLENNKVKSLLISIFGGITRCDEIAGGILKAVTENDFGVPIVTRLEGTNKEKGLEILSAADQKKVAVTTSLPEAAETVIKVQQ